MTIRQENILKSALQLFAEHGFDATSTSRIAKNAGVSEGLIFKHFSNKEGLLQAILEIAKRDSIEMLDQLKAIDNPKDRLKQMLLFAFDITQEQKDFWKLVYSLKWKAAYYDDSISAPFKRIMTKSFKELNFENPKAEAELMLIQLDGIMTAVLLKELKGVQAIKKTLLNKYDLKL